MEKGLFNTSDVQLFLLLSAVLTFGFLDGITAMLLIHLQGYAAEYSAILRFIAVNGGLAGMFLFKVVSVTLLIILPVLLQKKDGSEIWKINGFLFAFVVGGAVASLDNISAIMTGTPFISAQMVITGFVILLIVLVELGDLMDHRAAQPESHRLTTPDNTRLSEQQWIQHIHS